MWLDAHSYLKTLLLFLRLVFLCGNKVVEKRCCYHTACFKKSYQFEAMEQSSIKSLEKIYWKILPILILSTKL